MPNGKPGDHPVTDIVVHNMPVFSPRIDALITDIVALGGRKNLEAEFDLFAPPSGREFERQLTDMLKRFEQQTKHITADVGLRPATMQDYNFLYDLHRATMKDIVAQTWGWDDARQEQHFRQRFDPAARQIITFRGLDIGVLSVVERETDVFLQVIQVLPDYQRQGVGTSVIQSVLREAHRKGKPVALQVIKANRARRLYERLGFVTTGETETHFLMRAVLRGRD